MYGKNKCLKRKVKISKSLAKNGNIKKIICKGNICNVEIKIIDYIKQRKMLNYLLKYITNE